MINNKQILFRLSPSEYKFLFDCRAFGALEVVLGLGVLGKFIIKHTIKRMYTIQYAGVT